MNDVKEMLEDEIKSIMESMKTMSVDSEEYEKAIDALTKLTDRLNAIDKNQKELEDKAKAREEEREERATIREDEKAERALIRSEEAESKKKFWKKELIKLIAVEAVGGLCKVVWDCIRTHAEDKQTEKCLNWEQDGKYCSSQISKDKVRRSTNRSK